MFLRRKVAAVARILTAVEAAAIEAATDPATAAQTDTDLAAIPAFYQSPKAHIWYELVKKHLFPKMASVTKLALQLQNAQDASRTSSWRSSSTFFEEEAQALKDRVWQACLDNNTAFLGNLSEAAYFIAKQKAQPFSTTGPAALLAYRELWLELGACPTPGLVRKRVEHKLGRKIAKSTWYETLGEIRELFD